MSKLPRTTEIILKELIKEADSKYIYDSVLNGSLRRQSGEYKASQVGKIVEGLSPELRKELESLSTEDIGNFFFTAYRRPRPEQEVTRKRGPLTFSKSRTNE